MRMLSIFEPGKLVMEDMPRPTLTPGHAIVEIEKCGICGSDVTAYSGKNPTMKYPIHGLGHEGVGTIVEIGENEEGFKVGDRVALEPYVPDFSCHMCKVGRFNNCADLHVCGVHKDGMMTEYFSHPIKLLYKFPESSAGRASDNRFTRCYPGKSKQRRSCSSIRGRNDRSDGCIRMLKL